MNEKHVLIEELYQKSYKKLLAPINSRYQTTFPEHKPSINNVAILIYFFISRKYLLIFETLGNSVEICVNFIDFQHRVWKIK